ncbi:unnamed protein product [Linum tenue]|uniref:Uncharacterized protein n=1 Tax=Linum tenue TaxID=586396 RepID=A0AAV0IXY4_9ROSI|nr:unnamed protein product [Linum tenue]CAI0402531.1 unnamed protein product [Linum tenue]
MMKPSSGVMIVVFQALLALSMAGLSVSKDFDFFYFVQQWPGSYCDTQQKCCYPTTGKPAADFGVHGLWPNYNDGTYPSNCDSSSPFDQSKVTLLLLVFKVNWHRGRSRVHSTWKLNIFSNVVTPGFKSNQHHAKGLANSCLPQWQWSNILVSRMGQARDML